MEAKSQEISINNLHILLDCYQREMRSSSRGYRIARAWPYALAQYARRHKAAVLAICLLSLSLWLTIHRQPGRTANLPARKTLSLQVRTRSNSHRPPSCSADLYALTQRGEVQLQQLLQLPVPENSWKQPKNLSTARKLHVYVMPHSHTDPGWLQTFDGYFNSSVRSILAATSQALRSEEMRFIFAEVSFLEAYISQADQAQRALLLDAVRSGRLELVTGGWVMTDEASAHVYAMLDQLVEGHAYLRSLDAHKGVPRSSWSIDPFGHSSTMPYLLSKSGLRNLVINRVDYSLKRHMALRKELQFLWRQAFDNDGQHDMLTQLIPSETYDMVDTCGPDKGVCCQFDFMRTGEGPWVCYWGANAAPIDSENVRSRALQLLAQYRQKAALFKTDRLLVELGGDFRFASQLDIERQMSNYNKLFHFINSEPSLNVHIQWSTLSEYFDDLRQSLNELSETPLKALPTLVGDFHVYRDRETHYWSGYFTSRPQHKWMSRQLEYQLRTAEQLASHYLLTGGSDTKQRDDRVLKQLTAIRRALALFQHHDSLTGTSKMAVMEDNWSRLLEAINLAKSLIREASASLLLAESNGSISENAAEIFAPDEKFGNEAGPPRKVTVRVSKDTYVVLYNALSVYRHAIQQVQVDTAYVGVQNIADDSFVDAQIEPAWLDTYVYQLNFLVNIPPFSYAKFRLVRFETELQMQSESKTQLVQVEVYNSQSQSIEQNKQTDSSEVFRTTYPSPKQVIELGSGATKLSINTESGLMSSMTMGNRTTEVQLSFIGYRTRLSGAYVFLPSSEAESIKARRPPEIRVYRGSLVDFARVSLPYVKHSVRLVKVQGLQTFTGVELQNVVDLRTAENLELGMRLQTDLNTVASDNKPVFHTDQNCFLLTERHTRLPEVPVQGNLYPMTCAAFLQDSSDHTRVTLLSQQSLAVSSLQKGSLEVMLDRKLLQDDDRGVGEGVTDNCPALSRFRLLFSFAKRNDEVHQNGQLHADAHWSMLDLNSPVHLLLPNANLPELPNSLQLKQSAASFPCDLHVANMRASTGTDSQGKAVAVFLHRFALDCSAETPHLATLCEADWQGSFNLLDLFTEAERKRVRSIAHKSLTLMESQGSVQLEDASVKVSPFEIEAYEVSFV